MKKSAKFLTVTAAALLLSGIGSNFEPVAQAAPPPPSKMERVAPQVRIDAEMQQLSDMYGIEKTVLMQYYNEGWGPKEISHGAFLAYASQKSFAEIMTLKDKNTWPRVEYLLGLTPNDIKAAHDNLAAQYLSEKLSADKSVISDLLQKNYGMGDVLHGILMSRYCASSPEDIISMHNPPETDWNAVADKLGITDEQMMQIRTLMQEVTPPGPKGPHKP